MRMQLLLKTVGQNIREARIRAGLRQIDVNEKIGLTYRHYQNIEAGRVNLTVTTLCRLSRLFKIGVHELFKECGF